MNVELEIFLDEFIWNTNDDNIEEASVNSTDIYDKIYPKISSVLSTEKGSNTFIKYVTEFVDLNSSKLLTLGPQFQIVFSNMDKDKFFDLFQLTAIEINTILKGVLDKINAKASWQLISNNPIFCIFYCCIMYYTINADKDKNERGLNSALTIYMLSAYPSIYKKYFTFDPNVNIMNYTINNLSNKFTIKKANSIFNTLLISIKSSHNFYKDDFKKHHDSLFINFVQRIRNDHNSLLKKIASEYHINRTSGKSINTAVDAFDNNVILDTENNTSKVEMGTNRVASKMILNGVDKLISRYAAMANSVSKSEFELYMTRILMDKHKEDLYSIISSILYMYLYESKKTEINSREFIGYSLDLFKKTNSKNTNITNIKNILEKFSISIGIYARYERYATRVNYSRAIFTYLILSIQKYY